MEPAKKMDNQESQEAGNQTQSDDELLVEQDSVQPQRSRRRRSQPAKPEIPVIMDELRELIELIREHDFSEFELEREGFRVRFRRGTEGSGVENRAVLADATADSSQPATAGPPANETRVSTTAPSHPGARAQTAASEDQDLHIIPSPIVGTFYRSPSPNAESFVKIGSPVEADTVVCIIEAMKLMNEIQAETSGEVAKIYVENGQPVEYGQPLFGIKK